MEDWFTITEDSGCLYVRGSGLLSESGIREFFAKVPDAAHKAGVLKVLVDVREAEGDITTAQHYDFGSHLADRFRGLRVAIVLSVSLRDPQHFGETVALNRGADLGVFTDIEEAHRFLGVRPAKDCIQAKGEGVPDA